MNAYSGAILFSVQISLFRNPIGTRSELGFGPRRWLISFPLSSLIRAVLGLGLPHMIVGSGLQNHERFHLHAACDEVSKDR
jgi:hypothetical protein